MLLGGLECKLSGALSMDGACTGEAFHLIQCLLCPMALPARDGWPPPVGLASQEPQCILFELHNSQPRRHG